VEHILGVLVGVAMFCIVAPILAFCVLPIPAFIGGALVSLYRAIMGR